ncbi:RidA family protein [Pseudomonas typographi]|uniref:RidA family protein n=1 Tax=Pseudomonas typographi TaxID=2715964 RepID=A0ABR7Z568_9PSED|nr:RidA family protein [Pseudomonas typographi]MBD1553087.1 RidA family protein [Pseudomonas typographi]MBD1588386.1 RidA family protein [Pseudomonas typographi]MBD1600539.1 RidA family protein [Pseudomonas typographi]
MTTPEGKSASLQCITAAGVPAPAGHYSHAVKVGDLVYVSGVLPVTVAPEADFVAQAHAAMVLCEKILQAAGCTWAQVAQSTVYIAGVKYWPAFNEIYAQYLQAHKPARVIVPVPELHHGYLVEIQLTAATLASFDRPESTR